MNTREDAAAKAMLWAETMGRSSLDQMAAEGLAAADIVLFSDTAMGRMAKVIFEEVEPGLEWDQVDEKLRVLFREVAEAAAKALKDER